MDPEQRSCCNPVFECAAPDEPFGSSIVLGPMSNVVIFGWIWRREPTPDILLQMVSYDARRTISLEEIIIRASNGSRFVLFIWPVVS